MNKVDFVRYWASFFVNSCNLISYEVAFFMSCQSSLETGYGTSFLFQKNNNLFGMRYPKFRITLARGECHGHCDFYSTIDSFYDYLIWLQMSGFSRDDLSNVDRFSSKMRKSKFNPSPNYVDTILKIYKNYYHE